VPRAVQSDVVQVVLACTTHDESVMHGVLPVPLLGRPPGRTGRISRLARGCDRLPRVVNGGGHRRISWRARPSPPARAAPTYRTRVRTPPATGTPSAVAKSPVAGHDVPGQGSRTPWSCRPRGRRRVHAAPRRREVTRRPGSLVVRGHSSSRAWAR